MNEASARGSKEGEECKSELPERGSYKRKLLLKTIAVAAFCLLCWWHLQHV